MAGQYTRYAKVEQVKLPRSSFDMSFSHKTTIDGNKLYPVYLQEVVPGDTFKTRMHGFVRLATPLAPTMDNAYVTSHFFFVPHRLVWDDFRKMMGEDFDPENPEYFKVPLMTLQGYTSQDNVEEFMKLLDIFGLPVYSENQWKASALPMRGYRQIWNDWFRDQNLQEKLSLTSHGDDTDKRLYDILPRGKRHDYFTSALPWPQKGEAIQVPFQGQAELVPSGDGVPSFLIDGKTTQNLVTDGQIDPINNVGTNGVGAGVMSWDDPALSVDITNSQGFSINDLRVAFQFQRMLERDARSGTRYTELLASHFGVVNHDLSHRAEFLGGGRSRINIRAVEQTAPGPDGDASDVGDLGAYGTAVMNGHGFTKSFSEHGYIFGIVSVTGDISYQQGLARHFTRHTKYDFYWPALAHIGEQIVWNHEIFCDGTDGYPGYEEVFTTLDGEVQDPFQQFMQNEEVRTSNEGVFGYQERFAEMRSNNNMVTGHFRSDHEASLDIWHYADDYASLPSLNSEWIESATPFERTLKVQTGPQFIADFYFKSQGARVMPLYGTPGNIDRF